MRAWVIGIDVGTSGARAVALAEDGGTCCFGRGCDGSFGDATAPERWWDWRSRGHLRTWPKMRLEPSARARRRRDFRDGARGGPGRRASRAAAHVRRALQRRSRPASDRRVCASRKRGPGSHLRVGARSDDAGSAGCSPHAAPGGLDQRKAQRKVRSQRLEQCAEDRLRSCRGSMARVDRTSRSGCRKIACRSGAGRADRSGKSERP